MKPKPRPFREKLVWPGIIFMFLGISFSLMSVTLFLALSDRSFGVENDYYAKAVSWDETAADRAASDALGWSLRATLSEAVDLSGERAVMVELMDAQGQPVDAAPRAVYAFHHARRNEPLEFGLTRIAPGRFAAGAPLVRDGLWQLRLRFERHSDVFIATVDISTEPTTEAEGSDER